MKSDCGLLKRNPVSRKGLFYLISFVLILLTNIFLFAFFHSRALPGHDAPFYLFNSRLIYETGQISRLTDKGRVGIFAFPVLIARFFNLDLISGLRLFLILNQVLFFLVAFFLGKEIFNSETALLAAILLTASQGFYRLQWDWYSNFLGLTLGFLAFYFWLLFFKKKQKLAFLFLAVLASGGTFYIHNLTAFTFNFALFLPLLVFSFFDRSQRPWFKKIFFLALPLIGFLAIPYFLNFFNNTQSFPDRFYRLSGGGTFQRLSLVTEQAAQGSGESAKIIADRFWPAYKDYLSFKIIIFALGGIFISLKKRVRPVWFLAFFSLIYFLFSLLAYFFPTLSPVYPDRFVVFLILPACLFAGFFLFFIFQKCFSFSFCWFPKAFLPAMMLIFILQSDFQIRILSTLFIDNYLEKRTLAAIRFVPYFTRPQDRVIFIEGYKYWYSALLPENKFVFAENRALCGRRDYLDSYYPIVTNTVDLLSSFRQGDLRTILEKRNRDFSDEISREFILVNLRPKDKFEQCVDLSIFTSYPDLFEKIYEVDGVGLFLIKKYE